MNVYALSDLHGFLPLYNKIKAFLKPDDVVFYLGDACDRGPNSWDTLVAISTDPQFIYLKGNHEDILVDLIEKKKADIVDTFAEQMAIYNGTYATFLEWEEKGTYGWANFLRSLPFYEFYKNREGKSIYLSHAGFTPNKGNIIGQTNLLWDRNHIEQSWPDEFDDIYVVHGHTPVKEEEMFYCNGHKINIDLGTYKHPFKTCLLNLDTFEYHIFSLEESNE